VQPVLDASRKAFFRWLAQGLKDGIEPGLVCVLAVSSRARVLDPPTIGEKTGIAAQSIASTGSLTGANGSRYRLPPNGNLRRLYPAWRTTP